MFRYTYIESLVKNKSDKLSALPCERKSLTERKVQRKSNVLNPRRLSDFRRVRVVAKNACELCHHLLPVRINQLYSHWKDLREICYWGLLSRSVNKLNICLKAEKYIVNST
jgi:hypothetical protein